jgi:hypothetical protein
LGAPFAAGFAVAGFETVTVDFLPSVRALTDEDLVTMSFDFAFFLCVCACVCVCVCVVWVCGFVGLWVGEGQSEKMLPAGACKAGYDRYGGGR